MIGMSTNSLIVWIVVLLAGIFVVRELGIEGKWPFVVWAVAWTAGSVMWDARHMRAWWREREREREEDKNEPTRPS